MHPSRFRILAFLLAIVQIVGGAVQSQIVLCQGENGHLAVEVAHAGQDCGHGCEPVEELPEDCDDDHSCLDTTAQDDAQRQVDDGTGRIPAPSVTAWLSIDHSAAAASAAAIRARRLCVRHFAPDPSADAVRTFVLRI